MIYKNLKCKFTRIIIISSFKCQGLEYSKNNLVWLILNKKYLNKKTMENSTQSTTSSTTSTTSQLLNNHDESIKNHK